MKCIKANCKSEAKPNSNYCADHAEVMADHRNCVDCRFRSYDSWSPGFDKCHETGKYTSIERNPSYDEFHRCGSKGLLWQPVPPAIFKPWHYLMLFLVTVTALVTLRF